MDDEGDDDLDDFVFNDDSLTLSTVARGSALHTQKARASRL